jgi:hypothetical protein
MECGIVNFKILFCWYFDGLQLTQVSYFCSASGLSVIRQQVLSYIFQNSGRYINYIEILLHSSYTQLTRDSESCFQLYIQQCFDPIQRLKTHFLGIEIRALYEWQKFFTYLFIQLTCARIQIIFQILNPTIFRIIVIFQRKRAIFQPQQCATEYIHFSETSH